MAQFQAAGAERVHIVDLDAAFGGPRQTAVLARVVAAAKGEKLQLGGGLRSGDLLRSALDSGFDGALTRTASGGVDDVGAVGVPAVGDFLGLVGRGPGGVVTLWSEVLHADFDVGVDVLGTSGVAGLEALDESAFLAADEADDTGLALESGGSTDQERALLLGEAEEGDVARGAGDEAVDDGVAGLGVGRRDLGEVVTEGEADGDDRVVACLLYTSPSPRDGLLSRMPSSA